MHDGRSYDVLVCFGLYGPDSTQQVIHTPKGKPTRSASPARAVHEVCANVARRTTETAENRMVVVSSHSRTLKPNW